MSSRRSGTGPSFRTDPDYGMSPTRDEVGSALAMALEYCAGHRYQGYSLYDSHNGRVPFAAFGPKVSFYANQVVKRSPINLRPLFGVRKGINEAFYEALAGLLRVCHECPPTRRTSAARDVREQCAHIEIPYTTTIKRLHRRSE